MQALTCKWVWRPWTGFWHRGMGSKQPIRARCDHGVLDATVFSDEAAGKGPLMGIVSSLLTSPDGLCLVAAWDIPVVDIDLVRSTVRHTDLSDTVVSGSGRPELLFAVYRKSFLPVFERMPVSGRLRVSRLAVPPRQSGSSWVGG